MELYNWLTPRVMLPLYDALSGRRLWAEVTRLRELQWHSQAELEERSVARLRQLLEHAASHVPYYRDLFQQAGFRPADVRSPADLVRLPRTTKADLRANFPDRVVAQHLPARRRRLMTTGGSSGVPLEFFADRAAVDVWLGAYFLFLSWAKTGPWDTAVLVDSPSRVATNVPAPPRYQRWLRRAFLGERTLYLEAITLTAEEFVARTRPLANGRQHFIRTLPSYASRLATQLLKAGLEAPARPKVLISHGETLTPVDVAVIQQALRCPVANQYSAWDIPQMAQSCPDNPSLLHVNNQRAILRVVREDGRDTAVGEMGRVVVTDLWNEVMPFINYEIGDIAAVGTACPCGRGFPTLTSLEGRIVETIRTPGGKVLSPGILSHLLVSGSRAIPFIREYQAVQTAPDRVVLRVVPTDQFSDRVGQRLRDDLEAFLGSDLSVEVQTIDRIPLESSGKRLIIKSSLPPAEA